MLPKSYLKTSMQKLGRNKASMQTSVLNEQEVHIKPFDAIPSPKGYPILQNLPQILSKDAMKHQLKFYTKIHNELGDIFKIRIPGEGNSVVHIFKTEDARTLFSKDGPQPFQPGFERIGDIRKYALKEHFKTPGLFAQGEEWRQFRSAVQQDMMRPKSAVFYTEELNRTADEFCEAIQSSVDSNGDTVDLNYILQKFTLEAAGLMFISTKFGVFQGNAEAEELMAAVSVLISQILHMFLIPLWLLKWTPNYRQFVQSMETIAVIIGKHVQESMKRDEKDGSLEGTLLAKLISRCGKDSAIPTVMAMDAVAAGIDTTAHTATFLLYHLATNPEKQELLYDEILKMAGKDGDMTAENLQKMKYLKACQQESMRIWPIANVLSRKTQEDMVLSGYHIPKGTIVTRHGRHNDEKFYPNADQFIPERWIRGCPIHTKADPFTNLPFGHGPRACVGQRFARLELYIIAFKVIQKFRLEYHHEPIQVDYTGLGHPDRDCRIRLIPRY